MKYTVTHTHKFGTSVYFVICNHRPSGEEVIDYCGIDYDSDGECLEIGKLDDEQFTVIPDQSNWNINMETKQSNGLPMLDKWEALAVRHCKKNCTKMNILRRIFARRCGLNLKYVKDFDVLWFLVSIIEKFNLSSLTHFIQESNPSKDEWWTKRVKSYEEAVFDHAVTVLTHTEVSKFNNYPRPTLFKRKYPSP